MRRRFVVIVGCVSGAMLALLSAATPADATVSTAAASWTPNVTSANAYVRQLAQCGGTMYAVGTFTSISQGGTNYTRNNAFSFSATTGAVTGWDPNVNGTVNSIALTPDCSAAYLGGKFTAVGPTKVTDLAKVETAVGAVQVGFKHTTNGMVNTIATIRGGAVVLVGGNFTSINGSAQGYYASLDPTTGAVTPYVAITIAGRLPPTSGPTQVYNQQVSAQGDKLLFEGNFTTIAGQPRLQLAELDLGASAATLNPWYDPTMNITYCKTTEQFYVRDAAFSPDGQTIYIATTGYEGSSPYCDAAAAFTNTSPATVKWINYTGGDSLYAVAASATDVYVGGHQRWLNNPQGKDTCGPGCVSRPGIGDVSATSGAATSWNPTRSRGRGADDLLITPAGLWIASDTIDDAMNCAYHYHPGICFLPGTA